LETVWNILIEKKKIIIKSKKSNCGRFKTIEKRKKEIKNGETLKRIADRIQTLHFPLNITFRIILY